MARPHDPPTGFDQPAQNGLKARRAAIALFVFTTFGIMVILSFPLSRNFRLPRTIPRPLQAALSPAERLIRPIAPWLGESARPRVGSPRAGLTIAAGSPGTISGRVVPRPKGPPSVLRPPPPPSPQPPPRQPTTGPVKRAPTTKPRSTGTGTTTKGKGSATKESRRRGHREDKGSTPRHHEKHAKSEMRDKHGRREKHGKQERGKRHEKHGKSKKHGKHHKA
jgi:hypothetical protein